MAKHAVIKLHLWLEWMFSGAPYVEMIGITKRVLHEYENNYFIWHVLKHDVDNNCCIECDKWAKQKFFKTEAPATLIILGTFQSVTLDNGPKANNHSKSGEWKQVHSGWWKYFTSVSEKLESEVISRYWEPEKIQLGQGPIIEQYWCCDSKIRYFLT